MPFPTSQEVGSFAIESMAKPRLPLCDRETVIVSAWLSGQDTVTLKFDLCRVCGRSDETLVPCKTTFVSRVTRTWNPHVCHLRVVNLLVFVDQKEVKKCVCACIKKRA